VFFLHKLLKSLFGAKFWEWQFNAASNQKLASVVNVNHERSGDPDDTKFCHHDARKNQISTNITGPIKTQAGLTDADEKYFCQPTVKL